MEVIVKKITASALCVLLLLAAFMLFGCASGPKLGDPTSLQQILNSLPEIDVAGNSLKFEFGGDYWIAKNNEREFLAGTFVLEDTSEGHILILNQTHSYSTHWVKTPGPQIILEYISGPPATMNSR